MANAPPVERSAEAPKKKEKAAKADAAATTEASPAADTKGKGKAQASEGQQQGQKKEKKEKVKKEGQEQGGSSKKEPKQKAPAAPAADDGPPVPSMIDLRVGHIVDGMSTISLSRVIAGLTMPQSKSILKQMLFTSSRSTLVKRQDLEPSSLVS